MLLETLSDEEYLARLIEALGGAAQKEGVSGLSLTVVPLASVTSTMDEARDWRGPAAAPDIPRCSCFWPDDGGVNGAERLDAICFLAREQLAGRGREERRWSSGRDLGIYATFLFSPECSAAGLAGYSLVVGLAVQAALRSVGAVPIVKWPNDIVVAMESGEFRKLGGILVDSSGGAGGPTRLSVGIGINLQPQHLPEGRDGLEPISLAELSLRTLNPLLVFRAVAFELMVRSRDFFQLGFAHYQRSWERESGFVGREVLFSPPLQTQRKGTVRGVDIRGGLILAHDDVERIYYSGSAMLL